jgi:Lon protease-like protein
MELPLFPLRTVLFPGVVLPLHVFEARYRALTERCLAEEEPFGVVLLRAGREVGGGAVRLAPVGTMAEIRRTSQYADGRFDLVTVGTRRFRLDRAVEGRQPYLMGEVTPLGESLGDPARASQLASAVGTLFLRYLQRYQAVGGSGEIEIEVEIEVDEEERGPASSARHAPGLTPHGRGGATPQESSVGADSLDRVLHAARRIVQSQDPIALSHLLGGLVQVGPTARQRLLEATTAAERLADLRDVLVLEGDLLARQLRLLVLDPTLAEERRN